MYGQMTGFLARVVLLLGLFGLAAGFFPVSPAAAAPVVTDARIGVHQGYTRFVLDLSEQLPYKIFTLPDPYRVVIDLPEVTWRVEMPETGSPAGLVANYRYGLFRPGNSRVVIDASGPVLIHEHFILPPQGGNGYRLVLDLRPVTAAAFDQSIQTVVTRGWVAPAAPPMPPPARPERSERGKRVVVIDPGHGGVDPGAIGVSGTYEKDVTLVVARDLKRALEATRRYRVHLTRDRDVYIPLRERFQQAEQAGADIFISLHADSIGNRRLRGASVYSLSEQSSDKEAAALAAKENRSDIIAGVDLTNQSDAVASFLISLRQRETMNDSAVFAGILIDELKGEVKVLRNTHRFAGFAVLKSPDVPSVLVELGYLSNRQEEKVLRTASFRQRVGKAVLRAADQYFRMKDRLSRS